MFFPKIDALRQKFAEHIRLSETADGLTPEKVLVLEIAGDPQNLAKRLSKVEGFEFMTSVILDGSIRMMSFMRPIVMAFVNL
jgi:hypothetical protein